MILPTHITVGDIRRAIDKLTDDAPFCIEYGEIECDEIAFVRIDKLEQRFGELPDEDGCLIGSDLPVMTISLIDTEGEDDSDDTDIDDEEDAE